MARALFPTSILSIKVAPSSTYRAIPISKARTIRLCVFLSIDYAPYLRVFMFSFTKYPPHLNWDLERKEVQNRPYVGALGHTMRALQTLKIHEEFSLVCYLPQIQYSRTHRLLDLKINTCPTYCGLARQSTPINVCSLIPFCSIKTGVVGISLSIYV